jgi:hypothetical protein
VPSGDTALALAAESPSLVPSAVPTSITGKIAPTHHRIRSSLGLAAHGTCSYKYLACTTNTAPSTTDCCMLPTIRQVSHAIIRLSCTHNIKFYLVQSNNHFRQVVTRPPVDWAQMERLRPCSVVTQWGSIPMTVHWYNNNTCRISWLWRYDHPVCTVTIQWSPQFPTVCRWDFSGYPIFSTGSLALYMAYLHNRSTLTLGSPFTTCKHVLDRYMRDARDMTLPQPTGVHPGIPIPVTGSGARLDWQYVDVEVPLPTCA